MAVKKYWFIFDEARAMLKRVALLLGHTVHRLFAQTLAELLHTDRKFDQIISICLLHVYGA